MASTHFSIKIVQASHNQSIISRASYQSADRLYCEKDMTYKNNLKNVNAIVYKDILLPPNAPEAFHDRATLWNAVEKVEKQCNAQLARNIIIGLPNEIPNDQLILLVKEYCMDEFVSKGMCCDIAIHDKGDGNPHAHILLTMRALDEHGEWMNKSKKVYILDEDGNKIKLPSGNYKTIRAEVRSTWSPYAQQKCDFKDLITLHNTLCYLKYKGVYDIEGLNSYLQSCEEQEASTKEKIKSINERVGKINAVMNAKKICHEYESIAKEYDKKYFAASKAKYRSEHKDELDAYFKKKAYLKKYAGDDASKKLSELTSEKEKLLKQKSDLEASLSSAMTDNEKTLRSMIKTIKAAENADELGKRSIHDRLDDQMHRLKLLENKPARKHKIERN